MRQAVGLDRDNSIINLAVQRIAFDEHGLTVGVGEPRQ
jgi:hypothetical protein